MELGVENNTGIDVAADGRTRTDPQRRLLRPAQRKQFSADTPVFGSRPSDHYFRSVCLSVCLVVQSFSQPSLIRFLSNWDICYMSGSSCIP